MAARPLIDYENPVLHQKAKRITRFDGSLQTLIDDMEETMHVEQGVGLAAPQIGVSLRLCVIQIPEGYEGEPMAGKLIVLANPEIVRASELVEVEEGCLSLPGYVADVSRYRHVTVKGRDRHGKEVRFKGSNLLAQAFQHEIDHLNGILYVDRLESRDQLRRVRRRADGTEEEETVAPLEGGVEPAQPGVAAGEPETTGVDIPAKERGAEAARQDRAAGAQGAQRARRGYRG